MVSNDASSTTILINTRTVIRASPTFNTFFLRLFIIHPPRLWTLCVLRSNDDDSIRQLVYHCSSSSSSSSFSFSARSHRTPPRSPRIFQGQSRPMALVPMAAVSLAAVAVAAAAGGYPAAMADLTGAEMVGVVGGMTVRIRHMIQGNRMIVRRLVRGGVRRGVRIGRNRWRG